MHEARHQINFSSVCLPVMVFPQVLLPLGSGGHGWRALGCARSLRGRGEGAAASRPCIAGFPQVGVGVRAAAARAESE